MLCLPRRASLASAVFVVSVLSLACNALTGADDLSSNDCSDCAGVGRQPTSTSMDQTLPSSSQRVPPQSAPGDASASQLDATADAADTGAGNGGQTSGTGVVLCGTGTCSGTRPVCCIQGTFATCLTTSEGCNGARVACDQSGDCSGGTICCLNGPTNAVSCVVRSACESSSTIELCRTNADCTSGKSCITKLDFGYFGCS